MVRSLVGGDDFSNRPTGIDVDIETRFRIVETHMIAVTLILSVLIFAAVITVFVAAVLFAIVCELGALFFSKAKTLARFVFRCVSFWFAVIFVISRGFLCAVRALIHSLTFVVEQLLQIAREPHFVRDRQSISSQVRNGPHFRLSVANSVGRSLLIPSCVFGAFLFLSGALERPFDRAITAETISDTSTSKNRLRISDATPSDEPLAGTIRPAWIAEGNIAAGDVQRTVLSSHLWSTIDEAKTELQSRAMKVIETDFQLRHHGLLDPRRYPLLDRNRLEQIAVKEQFVEQTTMDFGVMKRVYWLVETSPIVRTELYSYWKTAKVQNRVIAVGLAIGLLTMIANAGALYASLKQMAQFSGRGAIAIATSCVIAWSSLGIFVANQLMS
jgi:hypothetical protein